MSERREIDKAKRRRDEAIAILQGLDDATITDFVRRARHRPRDGFPASSTGTSDPNGGHSQGDTPVEARVFSKAGGREGKPDTWPPDSDPVGEAIGELFDSLHEVVRICEVIQQNRRYVEHVGDSAKEEYRGLPLCANPNCDDFADEGRGGRCDACWKYRRDHNQADAPAETIERRTQRRKAS